MPYNFVYYGFFYKFEVIQSYIICIGLQNYASLQTSSMLTFFPTFTHFETVAWTKFLSVFHLFYLLHTVKTLVYLMRIRRVAFNCLVLCLNCGPSSNWVEVVVDRDAVK